MSDGMRSREPRGEISGSTRGELDEREEEPCFRCGVPIPLRQMGCKGGHCPNCGHPYPHGDCSD